MSHLLTELLLQDAAGEGVSKYSEDQPRDDHGRFAGAGFTAAGRDPSALGRAAGRAAAAGMAGWKTLAREAKQRAVAAGAGLPRQRPEMRPTAERAQWKARRAAQAALGIKPVARAGKEGGKKEEGKKEKEVLQPGPHPVQPDITAGEHHLMTSAVTGGSQLKGEGVNTTWFVDFPDGSRGVFKPQDGAATRALREGDIKPGQDTEREAAAWQVAKLVGMQDLVPETVTRTLAKGEVPDELNHLTGRYGSMQKFVPDSQKALERSDRFDGQRDFTRLATFDYIIGNEDRHSGNWMVGKSDGKLTMIDHGLSFPEKGTDFKARRGFLEATYKHRDEYYEAKAKGIPKPLGVPADHVAPYVASKDRIAGALRELKLPEAAVQGVMTRIDAVSKMTSENDWRRFARQDDRPAQPGAAPAAVAPRGFGFQRALARQRLRWR